MSQRIIGEIPQRLLTLFRFIDGQKRFTFLGLCLDEEGVVITVDEFALKIDLTILQEIENLIDKQGRHPGNQ